MPINTISINPTLDPHLLQHLLKLRIPGLRLRPERLNILLKPLLILARRRNVKTRLTARNHPAHYKYSTHLPIRTLETLLPALPANNITPELIDLGAERIVHFGRARGTVSYICY